MKKLSLILILIFSQVIPLFADENVSMQSEQIADVSSKEYQEKLFNEGLLQDLIREKKIGEARAYLEKCARGGSFLAQRILIECYLSEKNIAGIDFDRMGGYYEASGYKFTGSTYYNEALQIKQDRGKALELLVSAMKQKNLYALLMFAIMQKNGVVVEKNEASAKLLISEICKTSCEVDSVANIARFYYEVYFDEPKLSVKNLVANFENVIKPSDAEYTFLPVESDAWNYVRTEKNDSGEEYKYISETRSGEFKSKGNKKLVPLGAIVDLQDNIEGSNKRKSVRLDGKYEFKIIEKIYVDENLQDVYQKMDDSEFPTYRNFCCTHFAVLDNGLQVLSIYDKMGGSGSSRILCVVAFEKDKSGAYIIKKYGEDFLFASPKDVIFDKTYIKGCVVARYIVAEGKVGFVPALYVLNFEKDSAKYKKAIAEILKEIRGK